MDSTRQNEQNRHVTKNLSGLQMMYTDFDDWICKFYEHINSRSSSLLNETETSVKQWELKIKEKENKNRNNSRDQILGVLSLQDVFINGILLKDRIGYRTDQKDNLSRLFRVMKDYNEIYDYVLFKFLNSVNKTSCEYIKCKL
ncbi:unnamed protein product [Parnassius apollo]|uniref:(apollo) hypothetical protein n=1 Tax=Parnassius apollo TaxID=110799 RepID=A0A8S3XPR9_PARAO|nr:unnamed protein product [Parnassius apollo]